MLNYKYIAIEGLISIGKTMFAKKLSSFTGGEIVSEEVEKNPFLESFYDDMKNNSFQTQMFFLLNRYKLQKKFRQYDLFKTSLIADFMFEKDLIYASLLLNEHEFELYNMMYKKLYEEMVVPDLVIYLQASAENILKRIKYRGRPFEKDIPPEFIKDLNQKYHDFFFNYEKSKVVIVNTNNIDLDNNPEDFKDIIDKIRTMKEQKIFYNPVSSGSLFD